MNKLLPIIIGFTIGGEVSMSLLYIDNKISLQDLIVNIGLGALAILFWWKVFPVVEKWSKKD